LSAIFSSCRLHLSFRLMPPCRAPLVAARPFHGGQELFPFPCRVSTPLGCFSLLGCCSPLYRYWLVSRFGNLIGMRTFFRFFFSSPPHCFLVWFLLAPIGFFCSPNFVRAFCFPYRLSAVPDCLPKFSQQTFFSCFV